MTAVCKNKATATTDQVDATTESAATATAVATSNSRVTKGGCP